ncbi:MAG: diacylglycerol/lipid kinase family protein [Verrucomicrobiaceae bacterium]
MKLALVLNRESGSGLFNDESARSEIVEIFNNAGHEVTADPVPAKDLTTTLEKWIASDCDGIIVGGGDGTVASTADLIRGSGKFFGVLPLGTFNLEARDLEIPLEVRDAALALSQAEVKEIDLLLVNDRVCLCTTVLGFYPTLSRIRKDYHGHGWWKKTIRLAYEIAVLATRTPPLTLTIDAPDGNPPLVQKTRIAVFSPGPYEDALGIIPRRPDLATGKLMAYISRHLSRVAMVRAALRFLIGSLFDTDEMAVIETTSLQLDVKGRSSVTAMIDGEILELNLPCRMKILPKAVKVLTPA